MDHRLGNTVLLLGFLQKICKHLGLTLNLWALKIVQCMLKKVSEPQIYLTHSALIDLDREFESQPMQNGRVELELHTFRVLCFLPTATHKEDCRLENRLIPVR